MVSIHFVLTYVAFSVSATLNFPFLGDWGAPGAGLDMVGTAVRNRTYDFLVLGGDNFYESGVSGVRDGQFATTYQVQFGSIEIPQYVILGNHDYFGSPLAQLLYSQYDHNWDAEYYYYYRIFESGDLSVCGVFLDTEDILQSGQLSFLHATLQSSDCQNTDWVFVFGHHPIFSSGGHGDNASLQVLLQPILDMYAVDFYVAGHDHVFSHHQDNGVNYIVSGAASKRTTSSLFTSTSKAAATLFAVNSVYGFAEFGLSKTDAHFSIYNAETNSAIYEFSKTVPRIPAVVDTQFPIQGTTPWSGTYIWLLVILFLLTWLGGVFLVHPYGIVAQFK